VIGGSKAAGSPVPGGYPRALHFNQDFVRGTRQACVVPLDLPGAKRGPLILKLGQRTVRGGSWS